MTPPARIVALVTSAWLVAAACGPIAAPSPSPSAAASAAPKTVKIVSSLPLQGLQRFETVPIVNAIKMALEEQGGKAGTTTVEYESYDDSSAAKQGWDAEVEAANARKAVADRSVVAYIGPFNSGAAQASIPINCTASLAMVSPANTNPGLTKPYRPGEPLKYYPDCKRNFARVVTSDDTQGAAGARWAKELGTAKVFVLHDTELYGKVLSDSFRAEARRIGLVEVGYEAAPRADSFRVLAERVGASGAELVYYGGISSNNPGLLLSDLKRVNPAITFMGSDGIDDGRFLRHAGPDALGTYLTNVGLDPRNYSGKQMEWVERYKAKYGASPEFWAIYGYEAAKVVLAAIARAGQAADDRVVVRDLVMGTTGFDGVLGRWSFDQNGDTSLQTISGLKVTTIGNNRDSSVEFQKDLR